MIPISKHCKKNSVVVLATDPLQLGQVIYQKNILLNEELNSQLPSSDLIAPNLDTEGSLTCRM